MNEVVEEEQDEEEGGRNDAGGDDDDDDDAEVESTKAKAAMKLILGGRRCGVDGERVTVVEGRVVGNG